MNLEDELKFYEELREICLKYQVAMIFSGKNTKNSFTDTIITVDTKPKI